MMIPSRVLDLTGRKYNMLTVLEYSHRGEYYQHYWKCQCDCGTIKVIRSNSFVRGHTKSCGCLAIINHPSRKLESMEIFLNIIYYIYMYGAAQRNLEWHLKREDVKSLIFSSCAYCGLVNSNEMVMMGRPSVNYNGIDRIDNDSGYTLENCVSCCKWCNRAKRDMSLVDWLAWLDRIVEFRNNL